MAGYISVAHAAYKHLFYVHGCCINKVGGDADEDIVKTLKASGFKVVFDLRTDDSDGEVKAYATKVRGPSEDSTCQRHSA